MHRLRRPRVILGLSAAMIVAIGMAFMVPSFADSSAVPQRLLDQVQTCKDVMAAAQSAHQKAWGQDCAAGAQSAINAWVKAHPTPSPTSTT